MLNFGLTFRNSKWSDYRRQNLGFNFLGHFKTLPKALFLAFLLFAVLSCSSNYFSTYVLLAKLFYSSSVVFWSHWDGLFCLSLPFTSALATLLQPLITWTRANFFSWAIAPTTDSANLRSESLKPARPASVKAYRARALLKKTASGEFITNYYSGCLDSSSTEKLNSFAHLFRVYFTVLNPSAHTRLSDLGTVGEQQRSRKSYNSARLANAQTNGISDGLLTSSFIQQELGALVRPSSEAATPWVLKLKHSLAETSESSRDYTLNGATRGVFSLDSYSFNSINTTRVDTNELSFVEDSVKSHVSTAKVARWVYKYNLLHRKAVLSSHTNTLTKRLLNSGFYDSGLFSKNAHSQTLLTAGTNPNEFFKTNFFESYKNFLFNPAQESSDVTASTTYLTRDVASQLSSHEESYFWVVKRFYLFNTLPSLNVSSAPTKRSSVPVDMTTGSTYLNTELRVAYTTALPECNAIRSAGVALARTGVNSTAPKLVGSQDTTYLGESMDFWSNDSAVLNSRILMSDFNFDSEVNRFTNSSRTYQFTHTDVYK